VSCKHIDNCTYIHSTGRKAPVESADQDAISGSHGPAVPAAKPRARRRPPGQPLSGSGVADRSLQLAGHSAAERRLSGAAGIAREGPGPEQQTLSRGLGLGARPANPMIGRRQVDTGTGRWQRNSSCGILQRPGGGGGGSLRTVSRSTDGHRAQRPEPFPTVTALARWRRGRRRFPTFNPGLPGQFESRLGPRFAGPGRRAGAGLTARGRLLLLQSTLEAGGIASRAVPV
jgi:hypothetical protein